MVKLLVVEENDRVCYTLKRGLERDGDCWVFLAQSWYDGLKLARSVQPTLILLDLDMPGGEGPDFTRQLRSRLQTRGIPVIAMSTSDDRETRARAARAGIERCLAKPFDLRQLRTVIRQTLSFQGNRVDTTLPSRPSLEAA